MTSQMQEITLVIGGAASGKSAYAENLVISTDRPRIYVATALVFDDEMAQKVIDHKAQRGGDWVTIEEPIDVASVIAKQPADSIILLDCATLWLTNIILGDHDVEVASASLLAALRKSPCPIVIVSNETGQGIVPDNALSRKFRNAQGRLNQDIAAISDSVVAVMAGLPLVLK